MGDTYYALLGVAPDAGAEEIDAAFERISKAYTTLKSPTTRAAYDATLYSPVLNLPLPSLPRDATASHTATTSTTSAKAPTTTTTNSTTITQSSTTTAATATAAASLTAGAADDTITRFFHEHEAEYLCECAVCGYVWRMPPPGDDEVDVGDGNVGGIRVEASGLAPCPSDPLSLKARFVEPGKYLWTWDAGAGQWVSPCPYCSSVPQDGVGH